MGVLAGAIVVAFAILAAGRRAPVSHQQQPKRAQGPRDLFCHGVSCGDVSPGALSSVCDPTDPLKKFQSATAKVAEATKAAVSPTSPTAARTPVPISPISPIRTPLFPSGSFFSPYYRNTYQAL
jgi:hypothetical protein